MRDGDTGRMTGSHAMALLAQAEGLLRFAFGVGSGWEPPLDLIETEREVLAFVALPGVDPDSVEVTIEGGTLLLRGRRRPPAELRHASILRLELPQGPFERRVQIPDRPYRLRRHAGPGYLVLRLTKNEDPTP